MADVTVIGQTTFLRATIRGEGDLEVRGRIEGEVDVSGEVTIAEGALVKANVTARRIVVRGAVAGNLTGEQGVRLEDGARVVGDVRGATIGILEGALLRGNLETGPTNRPPATQHQTRTAARVEPKATSRVEAAREAARVEARPTPRGEVRAIPRLEPRPVTRLEPKTVPPPRVEPRPTPPTRAEMAPAPSKPEQKAQMPEERPAPPPPIVPVLKRGTRATMRKRAR